MTEKNENVQSKWWLKMQFPGFLSFFPVILKIVLFSKEFYWMFFSILNKWNQIKRKMKSSLRNAILPSFPRLIFIERKTNLKKCRETLYMENYEIHKYFISNPKLKIVEKYIKIPPTVFLLLLAFWLNQLFNTEIISNWTKKCYSD